MKQLLIFLLTFFFLTSFFSNSVYSKALSAPEFPPGLAWLNVDEPLTIKGLKGKVVLLDFWTYCCINCLHVIPDLKKLEKRYPEELVVIGVHSAKFSSEKETKNIKQAVLRYEIAHPVVNDRDFSIWNSYFVRSWPTLVLVDPEGYVVGQVSGEGNYDVLDKNIQNLIKAAEEKETLNREPIQMNPETKKKNDLSFPGKVLADEKTNRLFIADSNHNRIVIANMETGEVLDVAGSGEIGKKDGGFQESSFSKPQGMVLSENFLYVADTENHLIRALDLEKKTTATVAGTGVQGRYGSKGGKALSTPINSPWDLEKNKDIILIAMAGPHQIWFLDPAGKKVGVYAGSGRESIIDGPLNFSSLAQPSGLSSDGSNLYFADSEVSAIRYAELKDGGMVKTLVGKGLFDFGDEVGSYEETKLQHPLGVVFHRGNLYVTDTYNNKIKRFDLEKKIVENWAGQKEEGYLDGKGSGAKFDEPAGISAAGDTLYVADTNNHQIRTINLKTKEVSTFLLKFPE